MRPTYFLRVRKTLQLLNASPKLLHLWRLGLVLSSACIFLEGRVFLWEVPKVDSHAKWPGWTAEHFKLFEVVIPRPGTSPLVASVQARISYTCFAEILLLGTGGHAMLPPAHLKKYLRDLGIQLDVMNSVWRFSVLKIMVTSHTVVERVLDL